MEENIMKFVTVLMSVYGEKEEWLRKAIDSILTQTYTNFEFIIILDKPENDFLWGILKEYEQKDIRIILIKNEKNIGLAASLNKGIEISKGDYIVRMDADDVSVPHRIKTLVEFMESNPQIGVCSSWMKAFGGKLLQNRVVKYPTNHDDLEISSLYQTPISHGACIIRKNSVEKHIPLYNIKCSRSQDYELWSRLMREGVKFASIPKVLYLRRSSSNMGPQSIPYPIIHNQISRSNISRVLSKYHLSLPDKIENIDIHNISERLKFANLRKDKKKLCTIMLIYYYSVKKKPVVRLKNFVISGDMLKCIAMVPKYLLLKMFLFRPSVSLNLNNILNDPLMKI